MTMSWWQQVDRNLRLAVPMILAVLAVLLSGMPVRLPGYTVLAPAFVLMVVFYWTLNRPELLPPGALFAVGLLDDLLTGGPLGITGAVLVVVNLSMATQSRVLRGQPFELLWLAFAVVAFGARLVATLLTALWTGVAFDPWGFLVAVGLTVALYPLAAWTMGWIQRIVVPQG
jgi:rod shape-determining protein MreD